MQFPESWLREFCNPPISSTELAQVLTMAGMEVEDAHPVAPPFTHVVVGEVLTVTKHPNADRLNVCHVSVGTATNLTVVCGAPNVRVGIKVPCALVGAQLPGTEGQPFVIKLGQLRGVESQGMLCAARELGLADDAGGLLVLDAAAPIGMNIRAHLQLDDTLLTLKLTPNLAHCLSVYGVARELSALTGAPLKPLSSAAIALALDDKVAVKISAPDLCGRFCGRVVRGVAAQTATPGWMVERLARCGQRSVNVLVDISNYVMFEAGQPSHIFDLDKIHGGLSVRWAQAGESLKLLNGNTISLDEKVGVIADENSVESLAGIMGGDATGVSTTTQNIYIEAAFWWPNAIAGRSKRFNFSTEAGHRFERGVDPALTAQHVERITQLVLEICGGQAGPLTDQVTDQVTNLPKRQPVTLRVARAAKIIGMPISQAQCEEVMQRLGLSYTATEGGLSVTPPSSRFDLQIEEDLIEEVIRIIGYKNLPNTPPQAALTPRVRSETQRGPDTLRHRMAGLDYQETINFSFVDERWERELAGNAAPIRLVNPMANHMAVMRSSILGNLIDVLHLNLARKATRVRIFELGRVFLRDAAITDSASSVAGIHQPLRVAGLVYGSAQGLQWGERERAVDFFDIKGDVETLIGPQRARFQSAQHPAMHPGRCARVELNGVVIGHVGELHPQWRQAYELPQAPLMFELDVAALLPRVLPAHQAVQRQQSVWRDLSVVAGEAVTHDAVLQAVASASGSDTGLIRSTRLFDIYKPTAASTDMQPGERSLSLRLELLDDDAPLTDERTDAVVANVLATLREQLNVRLRG
jgi:phenylalanyl-tRNA synthetase beta chain